jgi:small subunit ribosomal protein S6
VGHRPKGGVHTMRKYEIMFIIRPNIEEAAKNEVVENFMNVLKTNGSEDIKMDVVGIKNLAYEIEDFRKGFYFIVNLMSSNEAIDEFNRLARISEDIIRYIVIKDEE